MTHSFDNIRYDIFSYHEYQMRINIKREKDNVVGLRTNNQVLGQVWSGVGDLVDIFSVVRSV